MNRGRRAATWAQRLRQDERGQITAFVAALMAGLLLVAGLVLDGGTALAAKTRALDEAQEAARSGAQALSPAWVRDHTGPLLDATRARAAAETALAAAGATGTVAVAGDEVTVTVTVTTRTQLLHLAGVHEITVSATATARAEPGVNTPDPRGAP
ncbi:pilus assembly protein TadG-related protein [Yinghuangia seranimata]|uniref:pilus assembly protein TadG-related protein n=1 Tax=Yinghuangia seranimata TaxID=408067 RepID=UPI00248CE694|nr:pilus assembly protein TadG-related protein [Yinghuangia seranimata]MDI2127137.1 pilus assembly protein TadG-related protein [Yinghuangia seranimata]